MPQNFFSLASLARDLANLFARFARGKTSQFFRSLRSLKVFRSTRPQNEISQFFCLLRSRKDLTIFSLAERPQNFFRLRKDLKKRPHNFFARGEISKFFARFARGSLKFFPRFGSPLRFLNYFVS